MTDDREQEARFDSQIAEPLAPKPGIKAKLKDIEYMSLLSFSKRLGRVKRFDRSRAVAETGILVLGAGLGVWFSGQNFFSNGVLIPVICSLVLLASSILIRQERVESIASLKADFDELLSYYDEEHPVLQKLHQRYADDNHESSTEAGLIKRIFNWLRL